MPSNGGTLRYVGRGDVDHLDPGCANYTASAVLTRAYTRQLVTYPATNDVMAAATLVADIATEVPTPANGGVSSDGRRYTFTIRSGVRWDTHPPRQVCAADLVRGIKRLANPVAPCPLSQYFTAAVVGLHEFAEKFRRVPPIASAVADYLEGTDVEGLILHDERTLTMALNDPTPDFPHILTLPFASPVPVEYLRHLPDSPELDQSLISTGPYRIARYEPGRLIELTRNPAWDPDTDGVRRQYVDAISVRQGFSQEEAYGLVQSGAADALWDVPPPTASLRGLRGDPRLRLVPNGMLNPCLIINLVSPNENGATGQLKVRQALRYALDKSRIAEIFGGPDIATVTDRLLPVWNEIYRTGSAASTASTPATGDPQRARRLLAEAGYPDGLALTMIYRDAGNHPAVAEAIRASLRRCGIRVHLTPVSLAGFYAEYLEVAQRARDGAWDIAAQGWLPDWQGYNARTYLQPHFDSSDLRPDAETWGAVYGYYHNPRTNRLIREAVTAPNTERASALFRAAADQVIADAAVVPITFQNSVTMHSHRVRGFAGFPNYLGDPTVMWLDSDAPTGEATRRPPDRRARRSLAGRR